MVSKCSPSLLPASKLVAAAGTFVAFSGLFARSASGEFSITLKLGCQSVCFERCLREEEGGGGRLVFIPRRDTLTLALLHREQALTGLLTLKRGALKSDTELLIFSLPSLSHPKVVSLRFPFLPRSLDRIRGRREKILKKKKFKPLRKKQENTALGKIEVQLHQSCKYYMVCGEQASKLENQAK